VVNHTRIAIISIAIIIPLSSVFILNSAKSMILEESKIDNQKIIAVVSFFPLYEFTKAIGGSNVDTILLVPSGVEPHDWEPTIQDLQRIQQADIIVINGIGFEKWVDNIDSINSDVLIVDTSIGISLIKEKTILMNDIDEHYDNAIGDPHIWLNPVLAKTQVNNIAEALIKIDPTNKKYYTNNADSYKQKLGTLDAKIRNELSSCKKDFIAFHKAFSYFASEYGLVQHNIIRSNEPHEEPTSKKLQNIINLARELNIKIIFTEEGVDTRNSQVIANEIGGKVLTLSSLEIESNSLSYFEKMEKNFSNLKEALCN
jgi:zinc transport system substrate-binding protein